jgi:hypothetical protein
VGRAPGRAGVRPPRCRAADAGDLVLLGIICCKGLALRGPRPTMPDKRGLSHPLWFDRAVTVAALALVALVWPFASVYAEAPITLKVEALHGLPGLHHSALSRFLAAHMADAGLSDWRFEPVKGDREAPNRVEWTFRLNPYAGGEVRNFVPAPVAERGFGVHRPVTIEVRLYLNGEYQTLVERQAMIQGGPNDSEFAAAVASATESLLGPSGAYRATDTGQHPASRAQ